MSVEGATQSVITGNRVEVSLLALDPELPPPARIRPGDAAADLPARHDVVVPSRQRRLVPTGFAIALPPGTCALLLPRSGLALRHGLTLLNSPGLVDSGYRGELQVVLLNTGDEDVIIERGQRIAQLLVLPVPSLALVPVDELPKSIDDRGVNGFGSSG
jgi:dUTP pyrophosphatase